MHSETSNTSAAPHDSLAVRLERGELVAFAPCPFALPVAADLPFLFSQRLHNSKKNISYNPVTMKVAGHSPSVPKDAARLSGIMTDFSQAAHAWLIREIPEYAGGVRLDRASFRPEEEATRRLRVTARNDLLHIDAFPSRPTLGDRILRLYVNIHPEDPRVWVTSDLFEQLLARYGGEVGLPHVQGAGWARRLGQGLFSIFQPGSGERTVYDRFMLRFHNHLKTCESFQERACKRFWHFKPGTAWLAFTDALSHGELRGRYALEHSFFISRNVLALPQHAPAAMLERACGMPVLSTAA